MNATDTAASASDSGRGRACIRATDSGARIWCWIVVWVYSIIAALALSENLKGIAGIRMDVGSGGVADEAKGNFKQREIPE